MIKRETFLISGATAALSLGFAVALPASVTGGAEVQDRGDQTETRPWGEDFSETEPSRPQADEFGTPPRREGPEWDARQERGVARPTPPATRPIDPGAAPRQPAAYGRPGQDQAEQDGLAHRPATDVMNRTVENHLGEELGQIDDIVIDANTGRIEFLAVGPGEPTRIVPPQAFRSDAAEDRLTLNITGDQWEQAPTIRRDDLANLAQDESARPIHEFYGTEGGPADRTGARAAAGPRSQQPATTGRIPGQPAESRAEPSPLPSDRAEVHPDVAEGREFGARGARAEHHEDEMAHEQDWQETREFGARPERTEAPRRPALRNPRFHHSQRGGERDTRHAETLTPRENDSGEFGAPRDRGREWQAQRLGQENRLRWIGDLIGQSVSDQDNQPVGQISDFILDLRTAQVHHAILSYDQQQYAIPQGSFRVDDQDRVFIRTSLEDLQRSPPYEQRQARMRPHQTFRYDPATTSEYGAPEPRRYQPSRP